mgnify:CR=1 FL=1
MSNDLVAHVSQQLASYSGAEGLDEDTKAIISGASNAGKRISIKGGVFRKIVNGKEVGAVEDRHMNIVFVKMAHNPSRMYYDKTYQEGAKVSPLCWSTDSQTPDEDVKNKQSKSCRTCPYSAKGSASSGSGSACRLQWRTAVVLPNDPSGDVMQLILPSTSCWGDADGGRYPFKPYIDMLGNNGISAGRVVTRMQFDTKSPVPKVFFSLVSAINQEDVDVILKQSKTPTAENAVKLLVQQSKESENAPSVPEYEEPKVTSKAKATSNEAEGNVEEALKKWGEKRKK